MRICCFMISSTFDCKILKMKPNTLILTITLRAFEMKSNRDLKKLKALHMGRICLETNALTPI